MEMYMLVNTLLTRCMGSEFINSAMDTNTRDPGMRVEGKGWVLTLSETGILNRVTGKMGSSSKQAIKLNHLNLNLTFLLILAKFLLLFR